MQNINELCDWYQSLTPKSLLMINNFYAEDAFFKDPFNEIKGIKKINHIFEDMFTQLEVPRFVFIDIIEQGDQVFITWDFIFNFKNKEYKIHGSSHLKIKNGLIIYHRDYWDVGEELFLKIPLIKNIYQTFRKQFAIKLK